jgi:hypothetical protein
VRDWTEFAARLCPVPSHFCFFDFAVLLLIFCVGGCATYSRRTPADAPKAGPVEPSSHDAIRFCTDCDRLEGRLRETTGWTPVEKKDAEILITGTIEEEYKRHKTRWCILSNLISLPLGYFTPLARYEVALHYDLKIEIRGNAAPGYLEFHQSASSYYISWNDHPWSPEFEVPYDRAIQAGNRQVIEFLEHEYVPHLRTSNPTASR